MCGPPLSPAIRLIIAAIAVHSTPFRCDRAHGLSVGVFNKPTVYRTQLTELSALEVTSFRTD